MDELKLTIEVTLTGPQLAAAHQYRRKLAYEQASDAITTEQAVAALIEANIGAVLDSVMPDAPKPKRRYTRRAKNA